ncbi:MAG TPA: hypothetical protein VKT82_08335 [Ktedonobacterales bacterium]|nr:hypothetical protein [Ktedonobacterales bacterium]
MARIPAHWVALLLRLYPAAWRQRYAEEMEALLEQHPATSKTALSLVLGAWEAHLDPYFLREGIAAMVTTLRTTVLRVFWAYSAFVVAGIGLALVVTSAPDIPATHATLVTTSQILIVMAYFTLLALLIGGLPLVVHQIRRALALKHVGSLLAWVVPVLAVAVVVGFTILLEHLVSPHRTTWIDFLPDSQTDVGGNPGLFAWIGVLLLAVVVSVAAISRVMEQVPLPERLLRFTLALAALTTLGMGVAVGAALVLGITLQVQAAQPDRLAFHTAAWWISIVVVMACSTVVAGAAVISGARTARRTARPEGA